MTALKGHFFGQKRDFVMRGSQHVSSGKVQIEEIEEPGFELGQAMAAS